MFSSFSNKAVFAPLTAITNVGAELVVHAACRYITDNKRIDFKNETKLNLEAEEEKQYLEQRRTSQEGASSSGQAGAVAPSPGVSGNRPGSAGASPGYHFICESFFLTAKGLHLGLIKVITESSEVLRVSCAAQVSVSHNPFCYIFATVSCNVTLVLPAVFFAK